MRTILRIRACRAVFEGLFRGNKFPRAHDTIPNLRFTLCKNEPTAHQDCSHDRRASFHT